MRRVGPTPIPSEPGGGPHRHAGNDGRLAISHYLYHESFDAPLSSLFDILNFNRNLEELNICKNPRYISYVMSSFTVAKICRLNKHLS